MNFLRREMHLRAVVGIIAAYALALQMLLAASLAAHIAATKPFGTFFMCKGNDGSEVERGKAGLPVNRAVCLVCVFVSSSPPLPKAGDPDVIWLAVATSYVPASISLAAGNRRHQPRCSRGPPQIA
jgi:hypothetical protein